MPAFIYLMYSFTHVVIDTYNGLYNTAMIEVWIGIVFTLLLNIMCQQGLGILSWLIISIPFLLMTVIASMILFMFRLNPATGQALDTPNQPTQTAQPTPQPTQTVQAQLVQPNQPVQVQLVQPSVPQSVQSDSESTPSRYSFPLSVYYGSLGNSTKPATTR